MIRVNWRHDQRLEVKPLNIMSFNPYPAQFKIEILTHLKLCLATATHNFKWVKIIHIYLLWNETFANFDVLTHILFTINAI